MFTWLGFWVGVATGFSVLFFVIAVLMFFSTSRASGFHADFFAYDRWLKKKAAFWEQQRCDESEDLVESRLCEERRIAYTNASVAAKKFFGFGPVGGGSQ